MNLADTPATLRAADPRRVARLRLGIHIVMLSVGVVVLSSLVVGMMFSVFRDQVARETTLLTASAGGLAAYVCFLIGAWLLTTPERPGAGDGMCRLARVALLIGACDMLLQVLGATQGAGWRFARSVEVVSALAAVSTAVGVFALISHLGSIAADQPALRWQARLLKYGLPSAYLLHVIVRTAKFLAAFESKLPLMLAGTLLAVFAAWFFVFLVQFRRRL